MAEYNEVPELHAGNGAVALHGLPPAEMQPITVSQTHQSESRSTQHIIACTCAKKFTRLDSLKRHINSKNRVPRYACPCCDPPKTFSRADHLNQHLRCSQRQGNNIFAHAEPQVQEQQPALTPAAQSQQQPLTHVHGLAQLPGHIMPELRCLVPGCLYPYGFFRLVNLEQHMIVHALLQRDYMPYQPGPVYPNAFPMSNIFNQEQGNGFPQNINYALMGDIPYDGNAYLNQVGEVGEQSNNFQQYVNYEPAGHAVQHGDLQANGPGDQGNERADERYHGVDFFE